MTTFDESTPAPDSMPLHSSQLKFPVVGIGASAGGLQAILRFFEHMPEKPDMAFVVVLHLSPEHDSQASAIFQQATDMPVVQVQRTLQLESNHVYVIAPSKQLLMKDESLVIEELPRMRGEQITIDLFLRTLAETHRQRAIGIIMSGSGSDGVAGMRHIKEFGGIVMVQMPDDAEYESMPRGVIQAGLADIVLAAAEMPQRLLSLGRQRPNNGLNLSADSAEQGVGIDLERHIRRALHDIMGVVRDRTGHDFTHYKRATMLRRIERRMQIHALPDLLTYSIYLKKILRKQHCCWMTC